MRNVVLKAAAVLAASVVAVFIVGCDDVTGIGDELGNAELVYELESDYLMLALVDVYGDSDLYLLGGYDEVANKRGLWYVEPPSKEPVLIGCSDYSDTTGWWACAKISPDKKNVLFCEKDGIYVIPLGGGTAKKVYSGGLQPTPIQWLDAESFLMFALEGTWTIKAVNINTMEQTVLYLVRDADITDIALSPDGELLFVSGYVYDPGGGGPVGTWYNFFRIYDTDTWECEEYSTDCYDNSLWSPDGLKVTVKKEYPDVGSGHFLYKFWDIETKEEVPFYYSTKLEFSSVVDLIWTPDSKNALASEDRDDRKLRVFAVDVE